MIKPDITFALVKTFYRNGKNQYMAFLPIIIDCTLLLDGDFVAISELQKKYVELYGLKLPISVIRKVLLMGKDEGYFEFDGPLIKKTKKQFESIRPEQEKYLKEHEYIIENFIKFYLETKGEKITVEIAEKAMLEFMEENVYKLIKNSIEKKNDIIPVTGDGKKIAFGRYMRSAIESGDTTTIQYISDIAKGVMIQNAIYLPNTDRIEKNFVNTLLILDTPVVLSFLGYAGIERQQPMIELIEMARESKAKIGIFDFTVSEVAAVLEDCANRIKNKSSDHHGKSIEYFIEQHFSYEEIIIFVGRLEKDLEKNGIAIIKKSNYSSDIYMDELKMEKCIDEVLQYRHRSSKLKDIDSLATTYNLRKGENSLYIENCMAIFITSNYKLIVAAKNYFKDNKQHVDIAMTDFYITNILWLKKPTKYPDLPMKRVIADIYSSLQPSDSIWASFIAETEAMRERGEITYDDVITLKTSSHSSDLLVDAEIEGINSISPSTIREILDEINSRHEKEIIKRQDDVIFENAHKRAKRIGRGISIVFLSLVLITLIIQAIDPIKNEMPEKLLSLYFIGNSILLFLSALNLYLGTTIKGLEPVLVKNIEKAIYKYIKKYTVK